ncbi:MAG: alkaline phosphatase [Clostridia bacterium]|nr:alkaline phosphatase [Clostridia bacterium]
MKKIKLFALLLAAALLIAAFASCSEIPSDGSQTEPSKDRTDQNPEDTEKTIQLGGTDIAEYTVIYSESGLDFSLHAAEYVSGKISELTGRDIKMGLDTETAESENEIVIGKTNRSISSAADDEELGDFEYLIVKSGKKVLLYGEEYMVASAAYNFVKDLAEGKQMDTEEEKKTLKAEFEDPKNFILFIGDGMGFNTLKFGKELYGKNIEIPTKSPLPETGGYSQDDIVAFRLPNQGQSYTHSLDSDITDSAAGGTALATGYKTYNSVIGLDLDLNPIKNLCELAIEKGKKTAVITTDNKAGATPAAYTAHTLSRDDEEFILWSQDNSDVDTIIGQLREPGLLLWDQLQAVTDEENGFFMMFEEAFTDQASHGNDTPELCLAYLRVNTALRIFLEYAMYHPDTAIIMTADHETGGIQYDEEAAEYVFTTKKHTSVNVPLLGIGKGTEEIDGATFDNTAVAKLISKLMGEESFGDPEMPLYREGTTGLEITPDADLVKMAVRFKKAIAKYNSETKESVPLY